MAKNCKVMVAGCNYRQQAVKSLLWDENDEYKASKKELIEDYDAEEGTPFYQYAKEECALKIMHEPDNQYDPAALQVFADGTFIGYVPRNTIDELKAILAKPNIRYWVEVYGGKYKYLEYDSEDDYYGSMDDKYYKLKQGESPYKALIVFEWD